MAYHYRVRDPLGNIHEGDVDATSVEAATQQLRQDGFYLLEIEEQTGFGQGLLPRRITRKEIIYITSQLAVMVDTGITLSTALSGILEQEENPSLRKILTELKNAVEGGDDFSTALARHPKLFDKTFVSLVKASEATGTLGEMLERIATYLRKDFEARAKVRAAMAYPAVMLVLAISVTIFLLTFVLPKFTPLFSSRGMTLPKATVVMMTMSHYLINYWYLWVVGFVGAVLGFIFGRRTQPGRRAWDWVKINLPITGTMVRKVTISRSIRTLGTMLSSGVPMLEAIQLSADVAGNWYYEDLWRRVQEEVMAGNQICDALGHTPLFPRMLVQMIAAGEESGRLDKVLAKVSTFYDQEVETALKTATSLIEPIMITVMGVVVGGIAMALLLPIFSLSKTPH